jgi:hypothetical protein
MSPLLNSNSAVDIALVRSLGREHCSTSGQLLVLSLGISDVVRIGIYDRQLDHHSTRRVVDGAQLREVEASWVASSRMLRMPVYCNPAMTAG